MQGVAELKKVLGEAERNGLSKSQKIADVDGSETWCLRENEMAILRRTDRAMVRAMCGAKLMENVISDGQACELGRNLYFYGTGTE